MVGDPPQLFDARSVTPDYDAEFFAAGGLDRLRDAVEAGALRRLDAADLRIAAPLRRPGKIVCIGLNYRQHANESGMEIPSEPVVFMKASNTIVGPNDDVIIPRKSREDRLGGGAGGGDRQHDFVPRRPLRSRGAHRGLHHLERRFGARVPARARRPVGQGQVLRNLQPARTVDLLRPTRSAIHSSSTCTSTSTATRLQSANTSDMIFPVGYLIWYLSQFMVLDPGDIVNTGTPAGVGLGLRPPRYLVPGDRLDLGISGLGAQRTCAVAAR